MIYYELNCSDGIAHEVKLCEINIERGIAPLKVPSGYTVIGVTGAFYNNKEENKKIKDQKRYKINRSDIDKLLEN